MIGLHLHLRHIAMRHFLQQRVYTKSILKVMANTQQRLVESLHGMKFKTKEKINPELLPDHVS